MHIETEEPRRIQIRSFGEEVFPATTEDVEHEEKGQWLVTLAAIAADLEERFGPPQEPASRHVH